VTVGRHTIRLRTTATALGVVGTALVIAAAALLVLLHRSMVGDVDAQARSRLHDVGVAAQYGQLPPSLSGDDDGTVAQIVAGGRILVQSSVIRGAAPLATFEPTGDTVVVRTVDNAPIGDGGAYRVAAARFTTPSGPVVVYAAAALEPVGDSMRSLQLLLLATVPALILLVGFTTWKLVGRTLEPVEAIRRQVAEISASALDRRVPAPATADEIGRLAQTMNDMLARLDAAVRRQRSFVADASHELRSPLATIRAQLEVALARPDAVDWSVLVGKWLAEQERLERLVDDLLILARADEGAPATAIVDLDEVILRELRDVQARGRVRVDVSGVGGGRVSGDPEQLRRVVRNLLDNAEHHASGVVRVELVQRNGTVELAVSDDGPGIAPDQRTRVFERFVRLDEARSRRNGGAGLGLAIVKEIVTAHGGTAEATGGGVGAHLVVRLPSVV
jgi:signal transduction histidine kinase